MIAVLAVLVALVFSASAACAGHRAFLVRDRRYPIEARGVEPRARVSSAAKAARLDSEESREANPVKRSLAFCGSRHCRGCPATG